MLQPGVHRVDKPRRKEIDAVFQVLLTAIPVIGKTLLFQNGDLSFVLHNGTSVDLFV